MKTLMLLAALAAAQCNPSPAPPPKPLPGEFTCADACENLRRLGCASAAPTPHGATCVEVCENASASPAPLPVACIVRADSCPQAEACE